MSPGVRKLALTAHITCSVGWLGAVAGFLALSIAGLTGEDARAVRAAYVAMELTGWWVILPLSVASLVTGIIRCGHCGGAMGPTFTRKKGKTYRYYLCVHASKNGYSKSPVRTVAAGEIEEAVVGQLRAVFRSPELIAQTFRGAKSRESEELERLRREKTELEDRMRVLKEMAARLLQADGNGGHPPRCRAERALARAADRPSPSSLDRAAREVRLPRTVSSDNLIPVEGTRTAAGGSSVSGACCHLCGCDGPVSAVARRCAPCSALVQQASNTAADSARRVPIRAREAQAAIAEAVQRRRGLYPDLAAGYVCAYSEIILEVAKNEHRRGDYASFDHVVPNRGERAVLCSRIVNDLKGWMTDEEFRRFVCEVLDPRAPRRIHGVDEATSREFLESLRAVMKREGSEEDLGRLRRRLKELSAVFAY